MADTAISGIKTWSIAGTFRLRPFHVVASKLPLLTPGPSHMVASGKLKTLTTGNGAHVSRYLTCARGSTPKIKVHLTSTFHLMCLHALRHSSSPLH